MRPFKPRMPAADGHVPVCVQMSGMAAVCPMVLAVVGQADPRIDCGLGKRGVPHLHCSLGHLHQIDDEGNILDAPATG